MSALTMAAVITLFAAVITLCAAWVVVVAVVTVAVIVVIAITAWPFPFTWFAAPFWRRVTAAFWRRLTAPFWRLTVPIWLFQAAPSSTYMYEDVVPHIFFAD